MKFSSFVKNMFPKKEDSKGAKAGKLVVLTAGVGIIGTAGVFAGMAITENLETSGSIVGGASSEISSNASSDNNSSEATSSQNSNSSTALEPMNFTASNLETFPWVNGVKYSNVVAPVATSEVAPPPVTSTTTTSSTASTSSTTSSNSSSTSSTVTSSTAPAPAGMPDNYLPKFGDWYAINKDIVGHLIIPGTVVNYPVLQSTNNSFYLNHNIYKQYYGWGNIFADFRIDFQPYQTSNNIFLYGHGDTNGGTQLAAMRQYKNVDFYKSHPTITFDTIYGTGTYKVITMFKENVAGSNVFNFWDMLNTNIDSAEEFNYYINAAKSRSFFTSTVDAQFGDQLLSIQVCEDTNSSNFNRYVLVARKVRAGESTSVDTSGAYQN